MDKQLIQSASKKLSLIDIVLHKSTFFHGDNFEPVGFDGELTQQSLLDYTAEEIIFDDKGKNVKMLRVLVDLGVRAIPKDATPESSDTPERKLESFFTVEATFRSEYLINKELTDEEVKEFIQFNAVHNVWPFWRTFVFNTLKQANLPTLNIPLQRIEQIKKK